MCAGRPRDFPSAIKDVCRCLAISIDDVYRMSVRLAASDAPLYTQYCIQSDPSAPDLRVLTFVALPLT